MRRSLVGLGAVVLLIGGSAGIMKHQIDSHVDAKITEAEPQYKKEAIASYEDMKEQEKKAKENALEKEVSDLNLPKSSGISKGTFASEYGETWSLYQSKSTEVSFLFPANKGGYIAGKGREAFGITLGKDTDQSLNKKFGAPITFITKNNTIYQQSKESAQTARMYVIEGYYVTFFIDTFDSHVIRSVHYVKKEIENKKNGYFGTPSDTLREGLEDSMVELINQSRAENGLSLLEYDKSLNIIARRHSQDMVDNNFFSHTGSNGSDAKTRMENGGFEEHLYAENIAFGQYSSMYAHEALLNSEGHRANILNKKLTHVGVGVSFKSDGTPMYTINFYTPF